MVIYFLFWTNEILRKILCSNNKLTDKGLEKFMNHIEKMICLENFNLIVG